MLKLQYFGHLMWRAHSLEKTLILGKIEDRRKRGKQDEMFGCHHWLSGHEFEQILGDNEGQGRLLCCSSWDCKELDTTKWLINNRNQSSPQKLHNSPWRWPSTSLKEEITSSWCSQRVECVWVHWKDSLLLGLLFKSIYFLNWLLLAYGWFTMWC